MASGRQSYVRKVLRSHDTQNTGFLSKDDLRAAMDRLAIGLNETEKSRVGGNVGFFQSPNFLSKSKQSMPLALTWHRQVIYFSKFLIRPTRRSVVLFLSLDEEHPS